MMPTAGDDGAASVGPSHGDLVEQLVRSSAEASALGTATCESASLQQLEARARHVQQRLLAADRTVADKLIEFERRMHTFADQMRAMRENDIIIRGEGESFMTLPAGADPPVTNLEMEKPVALLSGQNESADNPSTSNGPVETNRTQVGRKRKTSSLGRTSTKRPKAESQSGNELNAAADDVAQVSPAAASKGDVASYTSSSVREITPTRTELADGVKHEPDRTFAGGNCQPTSQRSKSAAPAPTSSLGRRRTPNRVDDTSIITLSSDASNVDASLQGTVDRPPTWTERHFNRVRNWLIECPPPEQCDPVADVVDASLAHEQHAAAQEKKATPATRGGKRRTGRAPRRTVAAAAASDDAALPPPEMDVARNDGQLTLRMRWGVAGAADNSVRVNVFEVVYSKAANGCASPGSDSWLQLTSLPAPNDGDVLNAQVTPNRKIAGAYFLGVRAVLKDGRTTPYASKRIEIIS